MINKQNWKEKQIGDHCLVGDGAHASIKRYEQGIMYLTSKNFKSGGLDLSKIDYISESDYAKYFKKGLKALTKPESGDVLFSIIGTIGEPYLFKSQDCFGLSSSVSILRPDKSIIFPKYLFYWIQGHIFQNALYSIKGGVAQSYVSLEMIKSLPLSFPPIPAQKKITDILSAYDDRIENNTRRIKILEEMAQMLYREWFVNFRFPNHENVKMVESAIGLIPEGWEVVKLGNHITTQKGYAFKSEWYQDYGVPIVKASNFTDDSIDITNLVSISEEIAQQYKKYELKSNEIIIQTVGSWASNPQSVVGKVIRTPRQAEGALLNQNAVKIFPQNSINLAFLFYCLKREEFKSYIVGCGQGAASQASITLDAIKAFEILLPSSSLLKLFEKTIYPNWELINNLRVKNINLRKTRDLLLPKLISGEIDVENLDIETVAAAA
jgi:type I restriction enzyme S subunit